MTIIETSVGNWLRSVEKFAEDSNYEDFVKGRDMGEIADHIALAHSSHIELGGCLLSPEGIIRGLHRHPSLPSGVGGELLTEAINRGGWMVACREQTEDFYERNGFGVVARLPFEEYGSDEWDTKKWGEPDMIFMKHNYSGNEVLVSSIEEGKGTTYEQRLREVEDGGQAGIV